MITDKELLELLLREPDQGLGAAMDAYMPFVYTIVKGRLARTCMKEDIEECVSDTFFALYESRTSFELSRGSIKAWLATLARRKAIDRYRMVERKRGDSLSLDQMEYEPAALQQDAAQQLYKKEEKNSLIKGILSLGEPDSEIFIRKYFYGQSTKEIAAEVALKENTVDKKVSRGLGKLKQVLGVFYNG